MRQSTSHSDFDTKPGRKRSTQRPLIAGKYEAIADKPGQFQLLSKKVLLVDPEYQRNNVKQRIVEKVARTFSWMKFGTLAVALRTDGSYWVYDGQHRKLGADLRPDVEKVPCLVFTVGDLDEEADAFLGVNDDRTIVSAIDKHRAALVAGDELATKLQKLVTDNGLRLSDDRTQNTIQCIRALRDTARRDYDGIARLMPILAQLFAGHVIHERVLLGLFEITQRDGGDGLFSPVITKRLMALGPEALKVAGAEAAAFYTKGGGRVWGFGMLKAINKGMRTNKLDVDMGKLI